MADKVAAIKASLAGEHKMHMADIKGPRAGLLPIVWVGIILAVLQQFVGINAVFYYSNLIWSAVGFGESKAFLTSTIISAVNVIFTFVAIGLIDRLGRKPLLLIGSIGMAATLGVLTFVFQSAPACTEALLGTEGCETVANLNTPMLSSSGGLVAVIMLNTYVAFFAATWGPIVWVLLGEMFPNKIRAAAMSVAVAANWIANFIVSETFPVWSASPRPCLRAVHAGCGGLVLLRLPVREGDQGRATGGHGAVGGRRDRGAPRSRRIMMQAPDAMMRQCAVP